MINYYHILGLSRQAGPLEIKAAYRKLALRYHPDKNPGSSYAEERFKEISQAYKTLSNPQKKAQHDLLLTYADLQAQLGMHAPASPDNRHRHERERSYRRRPPQDWRYRPASSGLPKYHNTVATAWAFGIVFAIAMLVMGLSSYRAYQHEQQIMEQTERAKRVSQQAEQLYRQESYAHALKLLQAIDEQYKIPYNASRLKYEVLHQLDKKADELFEQENYQQAASLYQLLTEHQPAYNAFTYARLVSSYEMIPDYPRAILTYEKVIEAEPLTIEARNRLAAIFYQVGKYSQALRHYQQAAEIVAREYQNRYGPAYVLVIRPGKTPDSHYRLHCGLGQTYTRLGMHEQAEKAFRWATFLRPQKADAYYLQGLNFQDNHQAAEACRAWEKADRLGSEPAAQMLKKHCS